MGTLLLGILCRSSWQTKLQLLKTMLLAVSPKNVREWCWKFAGVVLLVRFRLLENEDTHSCRLVVLTASVCCLVLNKLNYFIYYWMGIRKNATIQQDTCTSLKWTWGPAHPTNTNCLKAWACNKFSIQCINGCKRVCSLKLRAHWRATPSCFIETQTRTFAKGAGSGLHALCRTVSLAL